MYLHLSVFIVTTVLLVHLYKKNVHVYVFFTTDLAPVALRTKERKDVFSMKECLKHSTAPYNDQIPTGYERYKHTAIMRQLSITMRRVHHKKELGLIWNFDHGQLLSSRI